MPMTTELRPDVIETLRERRQGCPLGALGVPHLFDGLRGTAPSRVALIVVDLQENFFPGCPQNHTIVPIVNRLSAELRAAGGLVT